MVKILDYLPPGNSTDDDEEEGGRQTMLFSATQTKKVSDLAALSLYKPEYLGVHDKEASKTPKGLEQSIMVVPLQHKLDAVFSFIKSHLKCKTIIFFSSCSQVRHAWEVFCTMQPGVPLMALHGKLKQETRTKLYFDFLQRPHAVMFATDVASRGLDFPNVDWVVQADAPEDIEMYIHRVGRTARYTSGGKALLFLLPQEEEGMLKLLSDAKIKAKVLSMNPKKIVMVSKKAAAVVAASPDMNLLAKKAFKSYLRCIHLMPNKQVFPGPIELPLEEYAFSLGLASMPTVRFLKKLKSREEERKKKNVDYKLEQLKYEIRAERLEKKLSKIGGKSSNTEPGSKPKKRRSREESDSDDDDSKNEDGLLVVKKVHEWGKKERSLPEVHINEANKSRHPKKIRVDGSSTGINRKVVFNDDGDEEDEMIQVDKPSAAASGEELALAKDSYLQRVKNRLTRTKDMDRQEEKERIQEKHKKKRMKDKREKAAGDGEDDMLVTLDGPSDNEASDEGERNAYEDIYDEIDDDSVDEDDSSIDIKAQEELALQMLGS